MLKLSAWEQGYADMLMKLGFSAPAAMQQVAKIRAAVSAGRKKAVAPLVADVKQNPHHLQGVAPHATKTHPITGQAMPNQYHAEFQSMLAKTPPPFKPRVSF